MEIRWEEKVLFEDVLIKKVRAHVVRSWIKIIWKFIEIAQEILDHERKYNKKSDEYFFAPKSKKIYLDSTYGVWTNW